MYQKNVKDNLRIKQTMFFTTILCFSCTTILSLVDTLLKPIQEKVRSIEDKKELLITAKILDRNGFLYSNQTKKQKPSESDLIEIVEKKIRPMLIDSEGRWHTFEEINLDEKTYISKYFSKGFADFTYKLIYAIIQDSYSGQNESDQRFDGFIIPVYGEGLWGPIKGYICLEEDGNTIKGVNWYEHKETPGLGAFIADPSWHNTFIGKKIFEESSEGNSNSENIPLGIYVIKDGVENVFSGSVKKFSAVDGKSGATISGLCVSAAYRKTLELYRNFLERRMKGLPL